MKLKLLMALSLLLSINSFAQCPPDGVFNSQAEIDAFAIDFSDCDSLGSLVISGSDINDLSPLSNLIAIESLKIEDNLILNSLNGLNNITEISNGIEIINNSQLINLDGLSSLANFNYDNLNDLTIENNPELLSINGLGNANNNFILNIYIKDNPNLVNFNGLETIITNESITSNKVFDLVIDNNDFIVDFAGLEGLSSVSNDFTIENNDSLDSFNGLDNLIGAELFTFTNNDAMTSFSSLDGIFTECGIIITDNDLLEDIDGFGGFFIPSGFCSPDIIITNNPLLSLCSTNFMCSIIQFVDGDSVYNVSNNASGCNSTVELETDCPECPNSLVFNSQADIDAFPINNSNCETVRNIVISGNDINNLTRLSTLIYVENLSINNNPILTSLNGLNNINTIIGLSIINNDQLTDLDGLSSLDNLGQEHNTFFPANNLSIRDNENLTNISMLVNTGIHRIEIIRIQNNPSLLSLDGFESIEWSYVFLITNNDALTNLTGLENLSTGSDTVIEDNDSLIDLQGLNNISNIGLNLNNNPSLISLNGLNPNANLSGFQIMDNTSLTDISQLSFVDYLQSFILSGNSSLSVCNVEALCNFLASDYFNLNFSDISNNAVGCNDFWQVTESCQIPPVNDTIDCGYYSGTPRLAVGETVAGLNSFATTSSFIPSCNNNTNREDVWYYFSGESNSIIDIEVTNGFSIQLWEGECDSQQNPSVLNLEHVTNACGTSSIQDISITENTDYFVQVWNNTSGRSTNINEFQITLQDATLSTNNFDIEDFKVFPNPVSNILQVSINDDFEFELEVYSALGERVLSSKSNKVDLSSLSSGIYYLFISSDNKRVFRKIIKN